MPLESISSQIDEWPSIKDSPEYQKQLNERVKEVEKSEKQYKHLVKVNDVLSVLDLPGEQEEAFRKALEKQDSKTLENLAKKSDEEIIIFLSSEKDNNNESKNKEIDKKISEVNTKLSKINSVFTNEILSKNTDIAKQLSLANELNISDSFNIQQKKEILDKKNISLKEVLYILKQPWRLEAIIKNLWWASLDNPKYLEFRTALIEIDPTLKEFLPFENLNSSMSLVNNDIIWEIENESSWLVNIDLNSKTPTSKLSLEWSDYSFDKEIDKQALSELKDNHNNKIETYKNSSAILQGLYSPFDDLLNNIKANWNKLDLKENLKSSVANFPNDIFSNINEAYKSMQIDSKDQINQADILSLANANSPTELKTRINNIKEKFVNIQKQVLKVQAWILKEHKNNIKKLVTRKEEAKEKQVEVLKFMKNSWFDLIPKSISNKIIGELQSNMLMIPWLNLSVQNIDLENWHFGESWAFIDKNEWLNIQSKTNLVKFVNKLISWNIDEPLSVIAIANWTSKVNPAILKSKFKEAWLVNWLGWKYSRIVENLKNNRD